MPKLHEILAVEGELEGAYTRIWQETKINFKEKHNLFIGAKKTYESFMETGENEFPDEFLEMATTVPERLKYTLNSAEAYLDNVLKKEKTNQIAKGDIEIDGTVIAKDVPVCFLLALENKLKLWKEGLSMIPTLNPQTAWETAFDYKEYAWKATHDEIKYRTKKQIQHKILVQPTDKHPAQVEKWNEDMNVGRFITTKWCGMIHPAEKMAILSRLDKLSRAVKKARMRANNIDAVDASIGKEITEYLMG